MFDWKFFLKCPLPHAKVLARLGISSIHGIGVFAGQDIASGTVVFVNDSLEIRWVNTREVDASLPTPFHQSLYDDFAVRRGELLGTPESFDVLTVGWYVNEPNAGSEPNLRVSDDLNFIAARDIKRGEELTIVYADFS